MKASIKVWRFDPDNGDKGNLIQYQAPYQEGDTVLQALLDLYEQEYPVCFRFGCRFKKCGLCAVEINGRPRLACRTPLKDGVTIRPLRALPNIRDLVVDRDPAFSVLLPYQPWPAIGEPPERLPRLTEPVEHQRLMACNECLGCLSTCPTYRYDDPSCGGPFQFVKLAQAHFHPLDRVDRPAQAGALSIERCGSCLKCRCLIGIPIVKMAIQPLLEGAHRP